MKVGFFVPCYVDMLAPRAAIASYELLRRFDLDVHYIEQASCCGLPMTDTVSYTHLTLPTNSRV